MFIAVISHDFADGLNTVASSSASPTIAGGRSAGSRWTPSRRCSARSSAARSRSRSSRSGELLAVYAGFFLYMGGTDLLPEAHGEHASWSRVALTVAGFAAIYGTTKIAGV